MNLGMNRVFLLGNLGGDPELKCTRGGHMVLTMSLATDQKYKDRAGVWQSHTEWHRVTIWGKRAEGLARVLQKGSRLYVEGHLQTSNYEKNGEKRYVTTVVADKIVFA